MNHGKIRTRATGKRIHPLNVYDLQTNDRTTSFVEKDFALTRSTECMWHTDEVFKFECFMIIVCLRGEMRFKINEKEVRLTARHMLVCHRNFTLSGLTLSSEHDIRLIGYDNSLIASTLLNAEQLSWDAMLHLHQAIPIPLPTQAECVPVETYMDAIIKESQRYDSLPYGRAIMFNLFASLFYKIMSEVAKQVADFSRNESQKPSGERRHDYIFRRFIEKISEDGGVHRTVGFYSDALCITPKYLSKVFKDISGKTALEMINEIAIGKIKEELFHSDKSIKEIAAEMNFCNLSFFGKFVKRYTGLSPLHFRKKIKNGKGKAEE